MVFAFCRTAPSVLFIALAIFATGVRALECALRSRRSSFDHGLTTRAAFFAIDRYAGFLAVDDHAMQSQQLQAVAKARAAAILGNKFNAG
jgi:hypothetical protein